MLEVSDDGCGVPLDSRPALATPHATSKIQSFDDIYSSCNTLGFRGEALFCLANLSARLIVATRTADDELAQKLEFHRDGSLNEQSVTLVPRKIGTTVCVVKLFESVPVRRADMARNLPKQRGKMMKLMEAYAIFSTGVRFSVMDIMGVDCREVPLLATSSNSTSLRETISSVMGSKFLSGLTPFGANLDTVFTDGGNEITKDRNEFLIDGFISTAGPNAKASTRAVQYFCVNRRPVHLPKISKLLNDLWRNSFGQSNKPSCILRLTLPPDSYDINVSPDKQDVIMTEEDEMLQILQRKVSQLWSTQTNGQFAKHIIAEIEIEEKTGTDDDDDKSIQMSPAGMFKRRYAFAHDISKAKLQHECDNRNVKRNRNEEMQVEYGNCQPRYIEDNACETTIEYYAAHRASANSDCDDGNVKATSPQRGRKLELVDDSINILKTENSAVTPSPPNSDKEVNALATDVLPLDSDRLEFKQPKDCSNHDQWYKVQASFNSGQAGDEMNKVIATLKTESLSKVSADSQAKRTRDNYKLTDFGFETFSYRAVKRVSVDRGANDDDKTIEKCGTNLPISVTIGGLRRVSGLDEEQSVPRGDKNTTRRDASVPREEEFDEERTTTPALWGSFQSTDKVIELCRQNRRAMQERYKQLRKSSLRSCDTTVSPSQQQQSKTSGLESASTVSLSKGDFLENMTVIGQFNMGFIVAKTNDNHLWILDQHACDEKYNFEKLCAETVIHEQRLMAPLPLELSPAEETCIVDNMSIFEKNGFRFLVDESQPPRHRLSLTALPHSGAQDGRRAVQFGKEDVVALCALLGVDYNGSAHEGRTTGTGTDGSGMYGNNAVRRYAGTGVGDTADRIIARLPKAIAMFASRACRGSIMIGKALSDAEMTRIVQRLGELDHPWQCPHGRTTLNHLGDLKPLLLADEKRAAALIAGPTVTVLSQDAYEDYDGRQS